MASENMIENLCSLGAKISLENETLLIILDSQYTTAIASGFPFVEVCNGFLNFIVMWVSFRLEVLSVVEF